MRLRFFDSGRRALLLGAASLAACAAVPAAPLAQRRFRELETAAGGRLGVAAIDTGNDTRLMHRADERFAFCSTFKVIAASAILDRSAREEGLLQRRIRYGAADLVAYSPVTQRHLDDGMTIAELCAAAIQYSDNTAGNLLIRQLGGPDAVTAFARTIGDGEFRLDRWETELNTAIPGDSRDTTTPAAMAKSLQRVALGDALGSAQREQLVAWMQGNTTGDARIRAGVPAGWRVGDKTGSGDYGSSNDMAVIWPPSRPPIVLVLCFTQPRQDAKPRSDVLAEATRIAMQAMG